MGVNQVFIENETLIDLTQDTVVSDKLASGYTAHNSSGDVITGSLQLHSTLTILGTHIIAPPNSTWNHLDIFGIPEGVTGKNAFNVDRCTLGYYISAAGVISKDTGNPSMYTELIPVDSGQVYTFSGICGIKGNKRIHGYDENGAWVKQINFINQNTIDIGSNMLLTITIPDTGIRYIRISCSQPDEDLQFELGSTKTSYEEFGLGCYLQIDSYLGIHKFNYYIDFDGHKLNDVGYSPNMLSIDSNGNVSITVFSDADYQVYALDSIVVPSLSARDRLYIVGIYHPGMQYTYTIDGLQAVVPDGTLTITEDGNYDVTSYQSVQVSTS